MHRALKEKQTIRYSHHSIINKVAREKRTYKYKETNSSGSPIIGKDSDPFHTP